MFLDLVCLALIALLLPSVLAANVTTKASGIVRGSMAHVFRYDPPGERVVVTGMVPTDLIVIQYGDKTNPSERQYFFKNRLGDSWNYNIIDGPSGLAIGLGERVDVDVEGDGTVDLEMEYTSYAGKGTFTLYRKGAEPVAAPAETEQVTQEEEPEPITTQEAEEQAVIETSPEPTSEETQDVVTETAPASAENSLTAMAIAPKKGPSKLLLTGGAIVLVLVAAGFFFFRKGKDGGDEEGDMPDHVDASGIIE